MQFFRHLLTPHVTNNFRSKVLHNTSLLVLIFFVLALSITTSIVKTTHPAVLGISYSISETDLLKSTNQARESQGLGPLTLNAQLSDAARRKAADMIARDYWAHFAPDGTTPWSFIKAAGYNYARAGENLAKGFTGSQDVVNAWMNSPSHRENLLSPNYKDIGFAVVEGKLQGEDTVLVVQMFGEQPGAISQEPSVPPAAQKVAEVAEKPKVVADSGGKKVSGLQDQVGKNVKVDAPSATKYISLAMLIFVVAVLALDLLIVEKRKIPRIVGHNLDHIILLVLFIIFIILETHQKIL